MTQNYFGISLAFCLWLRLTPRGNSNVLRKAHQHQLPGPLERVLDFAVRLSDTSRLI